MHNYNYKHRSYGVVLWEIAAFGKCPLAGKQADEIIEMAGKGCLGHKMYVTQ